MTAYKINKSKIEMITENIKKLIQNTNKFYNNIYCKY